GGCVVAVWQRRKEQKKRMDVVELGLAFAPLCGGFIAGWGTRHALRLKTANPTKTCKTCRISTTLQKKKKKTPPPSLQSRPVAATARKRRFRAS
ncbi:MAG: hypothetical protein KIT86_24835, partial [Hydrogenophaga sp.]|uniref:hypothetical protein n=1 Tax=Hydrogenophaga sp. TaxID=1904254 RepID=UPI00261D9E1D